MTDYAQHNTASVPPAPVFKKLPVYELKALYELNGQICLDFSFKIFEDNNKSTLIL